MFKKDIYKYRNDKGRITISPYKPDEGVEYEHMYRLIAHNEDYLLTDFTTMTSCIDIPEKDLELWHEVHKDDLETPVTQLAELQCRLDDLVNYTEEQDIMIVDNAFNIALLTMMLME